MVVLNPADPVEARLAVKAACEHNGPVYLRFGRMPIEQFLPDDYDFQIGKGYVAKDGKDVAIIATGLMVAEALKAADVLKEKGIDAAVINISTIKPLDKDLVIEYAKKCGAIVTSEEHSIIGGLGSAVCEAVGEEYPVPVVRHGVDDTFGKSAPALEVLAHFGVNADGIVEKAIKAVSLK
jgi:transketolase